MRMRATVAGLTSRAAPMAASVQLGPASPWLAFSRMRAWVSALAGATPRPIMVCSQARSSSVRTTTCRLRTSASCSVGPPEPHEDEGQPPTTQLKAHELLACSPESPLPSVQAGDRPARCAAWLGIGQCPLGRGAHLACYAGASVSPYGGSTAPRSMKAWWASCLLPDLQAMPATIILISGRRVQLLVP